MSIQRYRKTWEDDMEMHSDGAWCRASDVEKLEHELAAMTARLVAITDAWKQARNTMYGLSLDLRQAVLMQRAIDLMAVAVDGSAPGGGHGL